MPVSHPLSRLLTLAALCAILPISCVHTSLSEPIAAAPAKVPPAIQVPWAWSGVIGTGQSLEVGQGGRPAVSTKQPYNNLQLSTGALPWPISADAPQLTMVALIEPIGRPSVGYPSSWPTNIAGETPHASMANELTALVSAATGKDFIGVHTEVGENGQGIRFLKKNPDQQGVNGHAYEGTLVETKAITRLAKAAGKTFGVAAIIVTHGENDAGNTRYEEQLHQLWQDYNTDLPAITGQSQSILMIVSQQNSTNNRSASTLAQWKIGNDYSKDIVCAGPKYQYPSGDGTHLTTAGYLGLGEKFAQIYFQRVILHKDWQPLQPLKAEHNGTAITIHFHVPAGPLAWETAFSPPHQAVPEWKDGKGFEVSTAAGQKVAITSAEIVGDAVTLICAADPGSNAIVGYAMNADGRTRMTAPFQGTTRWGLLKDSDPFTGNNTGKVQPNYAVAFEMVLP